MASNWMQYRVAHTHTAENGLVVVDTYRVTALSLRTALLLFAGFLDDELDHGNITIKAQKELPSPQRELVEYVTSRLV